MTAAFRFLEHTAEVGIEASADTCEEAFEAVGEGTATLLGAWFPGEGEERAIAVEATDREALLVAWVDELVYLHESADAVVGGLRVERVGERDLDAAVRLGPRGDRDLEGVGVKAATFHRLLVAPRDGGWMARVYLDV